MPYSNGNSFASGSSYGSSSMSTRGDRSLEPWIFRLQRPVQDRGDM